MLDPYPYLKMKFLTLGLTLLLAGIQLNIVRAQSSTPLSPELTEPRRLEPLPLPSTLPSPSPLPVPPQPSLPEILNFRSDVKVKVNQVEVLGNTVFSKDELSAEIAPFIDRELALEELLSIRSAITDLYTSNGYLTSGAILPPQDLGDGIVKVQVIEGKLEKVQVQGLKRLNDNYVASRLMLAANTPLNIPLLEQALQLLQLDPLFSSVRAELKVGSAPGRNVLVVNLEEAPALITAYQVENRNSPSVGEIRNSAILSHQNLLGLGDRLNAEIGLTEGLSRYDLGYSVPLNPQDGRLSFRYGNNQQRIIEEPFAALDINSNAQAYSVEFRQPLRRTPGSEFALSLSLEQRRSQTFILGDIPFSFSVGPENGLSQVSVLRLTQDWTDRSSTQVLTARSSLSFGLPVLGATVNNTGTDGRFVSWLLQFQWVQSLGNNIIASGRIAGQLSRDSLLPVEQFSIGGIDTVRGYRYSSRVGDSGVVGNLEVRFPIVNQPESLGVIQLVPFFDVGTVWNNGSNESFGRTTNNTLISTGLGLRLQFGSSFNARLDYGIPLNRIEQAGNRLSDRGFHFSLNLQPF